MDSHELTWEIKTCHAMLQQDWSFLMPWPGVGRTALQARLNTFRHFILASTDAAVTLQFPFLGRYY